jgi:hypothetical protein
LNLDLRSAKPNTKLGPIIESREMAAQLNASSDNGSWYRLRRSGESGAIEWARDDDAGGEIVSRVPPESTGCNAATSTARTFHPDGDL